MERGMEGWANSEWKRSACYMWKKNKTKIKWDEREIEKEEMRVCVNKSWEKLHFMTGIYPIFIFI